MIHRNLAILRRAGERVAGGGDAVGVAWVVFI
jgi:hypothetical protein